MIQFMVKCVAKEPEKKQEAFLSKQQELSTNIEQDI